MRNAVPAPAAFSHLWPGRSYENTPHGKVVARYRAVPDAAAPRVLLPTDRRAARSVLRNFRAPRGRASRFRQAAIRGLVALSGGWPVMRQVVSVVERQEPREPLIEQELTRLLGTSVVLGIHLGPPRANQKPVLQILDERSYPLAVAKLGINELTDQLVSREAATLTMLGKRELGRVRVPDVVHAGQWRGAALLLLSHLPLARTGPVSADSLRAAMVDVARVNGVVRSRIAEGPAFARMCSQACELDDRALRGGIDECLRSLSESDYAIDHGTWHGDWTDWNCAALGSEVLVWDWERCQDGVPLGWDALHYALRRDLQNQPPAMSVARSLVARAPDLLKAFRVPPEHASLIARTYLLHIALRYLSDDQHVVGGRVGRVERWILPVVLES